MKFAIFVKNLGAPKWTLWASIDRQRLDKYVISIGAVSSCIVMEISTQKWEAYLCILIRNVETLESNYSTTAGQISAKLCKTLSLIKAYV
ncbi:hypothetical protein T06_13170 [Trichinella sp. T6]|nr:hypothetical protein T06_13170 [Trichinella sp. T6]